MINNLLLTNSKLPQRIKNSLEDSGLNEYYSEVYRECHPHLEGKHFEKMFNNNPKKLYSCIWELAIAKFFYDYYKNRKDANNVFYKRKEIPAGLSCNPDFLIKINGKQFFVEAVQIQREFSDLCIQIYSDGWKNNEKFENLVSITKSASGDQDIIIHNILSSRFDFVYKYNDNNMKNEESLSMQYNIYQWILATFYLKRNNLIPTVDKIEENYKKLMELDHIRNYDNLSLPLSEFRDVVRHWISSSIKAKLNKYKNKEKLCDYILKNKIGFILAIGLSVRDNIADLHIHNIISKILKEYFIDSNYSWLSGVLINENYSRMFPRYFQDEWVDVDNDFVIYHNPNAKLKIPKKALPVHDEVIYNIPIDEGLIIE